MYTYTLTITKADILKAVRMQADYVADRKIGDASSFDKISLEPESDEVLEPYLEGAMSEIDKALRQYVSDFSETTTEYILTLNLPTSEANNMKGLQYAAEHYLENAVLSSWYDVVNSSDAELSRTKASAYLERLKTIAFWRERPGKANITPEDAPWQDIEIEGTDSTTTSTTTTDTAKDGQATETTTSTEEETA